MLKYFGQVAFLLLCFIQFLEASSGKDSKGTPGTKDEELILFMIPKHCFEELLQFKLTKHCVSLIISKGLSLGIILGGVLVKVPQIIKIIKNSSAEGISLASCYSEVRSSSSFPALTALW